ncbi:MAG: MerR family transcriptional regulator [Candidatus Obscuribacterales bacterium]|nr:MerR family transcriptional regulator [Candidatus Obscuribacterales bacterium]
MGSQDLMSINTVAARLGLSVHQLRRWELMFGLDIKRGRGQQRQYRPEDLTVLERIKELVEQGWPTSQIRPQIEAEGLITPRLIGVPQQPGNPEVVLESIIGFRNFAERRFIEISKQIDELRQLVISITLKQELAGEVDSPWKPVREEEEESIETDTSPVEPPPQRPVEEITLGPQIAVSTDVHSRPVSSTQIPPQPQPEPQIQTSAPAASVPSFSTAGISAGIATGSTGSTVSAEAEVAFEEPESSALSEQRAEFSEGASSQENESEARVETASHEAPSVVGPAVSNAVPAVPAATAAATPPAAPPQAGAGPDYHIDEVTDQNYLTVLGKALDIIGWTDEQADEYAEKTFQVPHWDELGRSYAEKMVAHIRSLLSGDSGASEAEVESKSESSPTPPPAPTPEPAPPAPPEVDVDHQLVDAGTEAEAASAPSDAGPSISSVVSSASHGQPSVPGSNFAPGAVQSGGEENDIPQPIIRPLGQVDDSQGTPPSAPAQEEDQGGEEQSFNP